MEEGSTGLPSVPLEVLWDVLLNGNRDYIPTLRLVCRSWRDTTTALITEMSCSARSELDLRKFSALRGLQLHGRAQYDVLMHLGVTDVLRLEKLDLSCEDLSCTELLTLLSFLPTLHALTLRCARLPRALASLLTLVPTLESLDLIYCLTDDNAEASEEHTSTPALQLISTTAITSPSQLASSSITSTVSTATTNFTASVQGTSSTTFVAPPPPPPGSPPPPPMMFTNPTPPRTMEHTSTSVGTGPPPPPPPGPPPPPPLMLTPQPMLAATNTHTHTPHRATRSTATFSAAPASVQGNRSCRPTQTTGSTAGHPSTSTSMRSHSYPPKPPPRPAPPVFFPAGSTSSSARRACRSPTNQPNSACITTNPPTGPPQGSGLTLIANRMPVKKVVDNRVLGSPVCASVPWQFHLHSKLGVGPAQQGDNRSVDVPVTGQGQAFKLKSLLLRQVTVDEEGFRQLACLTGLTKLSLLQDAVPDAVGHGMNLDHLSLLSTLDTLHSLHVRSFQVNNGLTVERFAPLAPSLGHVTHLMLESRIDRFLGSTAGPLPGLLNALGHLTSLQQLHVCMPGVIRQNFSDAFKSLPQHIMSGLTHMELIKSGTGGKLSLDGNASDADMQWISINMSQLQQMAIGQSGSPHMTSAGIEHLRRMTALTHLSLANCSCVQAFSLTQLGDLANLTHVDLMNQLTLTDVELQAFSKSHNLTHLNLRGCWKVCLARLGPGKEPSDQPTTIQQSNCHLLAVWPKLQHLDVSETKVGDEGLAQLSVLPELRSLRLRRCWNITSGCTGGLRHLIKGAARFSLRALDCRHTNLDDGAAECIAMLPSLVYLDVSQTYVTSLGLMALCQGHLASSIRHLSLSRLNLLDEVMPKLVLMRDLRTLDLSHCRCVTQSGLVALLSPTDRPPRLRSAMLEGCWGVPLSIIISELMASVLPQWSAETRGDAADFFWRPDVTA